MIIIPIKWLLYNWEYILFSDKPKWINPRQQLHQLLEDMYDNTLIIFTSDNGGPIYEPGAASNHPLRGSKYNDWEGGVRTNAFVSGENLNILAHQWSD